LKLLLDSHVLIWWIAESPRLDPSVVERIEDEANDVLISPVSVWEIEVKKARGKLDFPGHTALLIQAAGFKPLPITPHHAHVAATLPQHHRDPFDRMLVAQSQVEDAVLVTADGALRRYDVAILPAAT
jgi:PIN domain nuclease of toxin-antitoxin system